MVRRCNAFKRGSLRPNWEGMTNVFDTPEKQIAARPAVRAWLVFMAVLVFAMVIVGGATRLTDSGLSITEWQPILGAIPPLNEADWQEALEKYRNACKIVSYENYPRQWIDIRTYIGNTEWKLGKRIKGE